MLCSHVLKQEIVETLTDSGKSALASYEKMI